MIKEIYAAALSLNGSYGLFTYFLGNIVHYDEVVLMNNIFRDLFIGTVMMYAIDLFTEGKIQEVGKDCYKYSLIHFTNLALIIYPVVIF